MLILEILKRNEAEISKLLKDEKGTMGDQTQGKLDFDSMVANILNEHKDEIRKNVEQQSKLISNRLQQRQVLHWMKRTPNITNTKGLNVTTRNILLTR